jgi:hypothetical protein
VFRDALTAIASASPTPRRFVHCSTTHTSP